MSLKNLNIYFNNIKTKFPEAKYEDVELFYNYVKCYDDGRMIVDEYLNCDGNNNINCYCTINCYNCIDCYYCAYCNDCYKCIWVQGKMYKTKENDSGRINDYYYEDFKEYIQKDL
jgi:hypothetical protein